MEGLPSASWSLSQRVPALPVLWGQQTICPGPWKHFKGIRVGNTGGTKRGATGRSTEDMNEARRDQGQDRSSKGSLAEQNQMAGRLEQSTDGDPGKQMCRVRKTCEVELGPGLHPLQDPEAGSWSWKNWGPELRFKTIIGPGSKIKPQS